MPGDPKQVSRTLAADLESWLPVGLLQDLGQSSLQSIGLPDVRVHVENVTFHDFSAYEYIFDPHLQAGMEGTEGAERPLEFSQRFVSKIQEFLEVVANKPFVFNSDQGALIDLCRYVLECYDSGLAKYHPELQGDARLLRLWTVLDVFLTFLGEFQAGDYNYGTVPDQSSTVSATYTYYTNLNDQGRVKFIRNYLKPFLEDCALSANPASTPNIYHWVKFFKRVVQAGNFFPAESVNFGLRLIYRQEWRTLGDQQGELVRTVPLAPGQKEKVSTKIFRRNKGSRQLELIEATETTTETSESTKDSTEIVEEAARSTKSHVDGEAGYNGLLYSGKMSFGLAEEEAEKSSEAKKKLSEKMQKTASKMRHETKITVSTESEESFEETRASEIGNPNDEIPITLMYHRLQRAFEVHTYLAEVASVVFVAEEVPVVDEKWIKRYDWILSEVLLDPSFREPLEWLSKNDEVMEPADLDENLLKFLQSATTSVEAVATMPGSITNIYDSALESYHAAATDTLARQREWKAMKSKIARLKQHIVDNLLHYCRAVWSSEDPEVRMLRYMNIYIPSKVTWKAPAPVTTGGGSVGTEPPMLAHPPDRPGLFPRHQAATEAMWGLSHEIADYVPLSEVINPAGPIGFFGNYAIFYIKDTTIEGLNEALTWYRLKYAEPSVLIISGDEKNEGNLDIKGEITPESPLVLTYHVYELKFSRVPPERPRYVLNLLVMSETMSETRKLIKEGTYPDSELTIDLGATLGFKLTIKGEPANGDTFKICASYPKLCDPELKILRSRYPVPLPMDDDLIQEMLTFVPGLRQKLQSLGSPAGESGSVPAQGAQTHWANLSESQQRYLAANYHSFLLRQEHTRRFVVDTNNLVLDIYTASGSTLEPFKRAHRFIDVVKAATEVERRKKLLARDQFGDPDIERMVVVSQGNAPTPAIITGVETFNSGDSAKTSGDGAKTSGMS